ncbi:hypothetical protein [Pseudomonas batumici]|uniref:Uncharacterized protein n=1 Tax=Pseudomonas batumici TaxID=226910 RepID=A0A0C2IC02_9PSED|nr:hypothetical protein [Pseudomonas batumici]KIH82542.1 hypothetical protein UCMB321_3677 [Pseudomonas batumici]
MRARFKPSFTIPATGLLVLLLGGSALAAQAAVNVEDLDAGRFDRLAATHGDTSSGYSLRNTDFTVDDFQKMKELQKRNADELENLKKIINDQARVIEEFKRNSSSSSNSNNSDLSGLKRSVSDQDRSIDKLSREVDDLKRSSGSSSSSNSSELSSLKRDVSDLKHDLESLKRSVDDLGRKVK